MVRMPLSRLSGWRGWSRNEGGGQVRGHGHQVGTQGRGQRVGCRGAVSGRGAGVWSAGGVQGGQLAGLQVTECGPGP